MAFTDFLSRLSSGKVLPPSHYNENFVLTSIEKNRNILLNSSNFFPVNRVIVDRPSVAVNTIVTSNLPSGTNISSGDRNFTDSSLASFKLRQIAAIFILYSRVAQKL